MSQKSLRQWSQRERRKDFTDVCQRLELELAIECPRTPRRHLDVYLRLAESLLDGIDATTDGFKADGRIRLAGLRRRVLERGLQHCN